MISDKLFEKGVIRIGQQIIETDAGTDKDLFYPGKGTQFSE